MKLLRAILLICHLAVLLGILGTYLNSFVPPKVFPYFNFLSLSFPVLLIFYAMLTLMWILMWKKRAIFFLAAALVFIPLIKPWVNIQSDRKAEGTIKVSTFNIRNGYNGNQNKVREHLQESTADVFFAQEAGGLKVENSGLKYSAEGYPVTMIYSRHKILEKGPVISKEGIGEAQFADIEIEGKRIRCVNVYLEPYFLSKSMVKPTQNYEVNEDKAKDLIRRMAPTFKKHQEQIEKVRSFVKNSPYPVILGGDFNAVPNSYEYYQMKSVLNDSFLEAGKGLGTSFHDYKFPIRIDYIFTSEEFEAVSYEIDRSNHISDHFPVIAEIKFAD